MSMQQPTVSPRAASVSTDDIISLLRNSTQHQYNAKELDAANANIELNVTNLFGQDYEFQSISNTNGELSLYYPRRLLVPVLDKWAESATSKIQSTVDIRDLFVRSRIARCRSRFVVPVILVDRKFICRSATVASWGEVYSRSGVDLFMDAGNRTTVPPVLDSHPINSAASTAADLDGPPNSAIAGAAAAADSGNVEQPQQQNIFDKLRGADIDLLKVLDIGAVVNLMVEKKKIMFGVNVTSSENSDKENRYREFQLLLLPYPGCEHFRELSTQNYNGELMFYDWSQPLNDATFDVPSHLSSRVVTDWSFWRSWNSIDLTKNYLQLILRHLESNNHGVLIHCLSGWDRTPLFISLLRLSLWADGFIHQSLTTEEILYLTLAYDWYLFGHCLPERLHRGEEILYFTFMMLPHLSGKEFVYKSSDAPSSNVVTRQPTSSTVENGSIYSISAISHFTKPVTDDSAINFHRSNSQVLIGHSSDLIQQAENVQASSTPKTVREEKLLAVFQLFHVCYRIVIPNRPPPVVSSINTLPQSLSAFNPRPLGREIARSINNFIGQWRTQPR